MEETDQKRVDSNCYGYVAFELGLIDKEIFQYPEKVLESLEVVSSIEEADVVGVIGKTNANGYLHMALVNPLDRTTVTQRPNFSFPVETISLQQLRENYPAPKNEFVYLKKKVEQQSLSRKFGTFLVQRLRNRF